MLAAKSLHISYVVSYFHDTAFEMRAGFGAVVQFRFHECIVLFIKSNLVQINKIGKK